MSTLHVRAQRSRIIHEFSLWVAVSAARQGIKVKGHKLYPFLNSVDLATVLDPNRSWTVEEFQCWHKGQVVRLDGAASIGIGWSAKLINMLLKTRVYVACEGHPSLPAVIHPPIDNFLIKHISNRYSSADPRNAAMLRMCKGGIPITGVRTYEQYLNVIDGLSQVAKRENCTLFEVESLWSARDADGSN
jgi:hypothetical protein